MLKGCPRVCTEFISMRSDLAQIPRPLLVVRAATSIRGRSAVRLRPTPIIRFTMGDLPNIDVNKAGVGHLQYTTSRITLSPGPLSVFDADGSAGVIHQNSDLGLPGVSGAAGGGRLACGVIQ